MFSFEPWVSIVIVLSVTALIIAPDIRAKWRKRPTAIDYGEKDGIFGDVVVVEKHSPADPFALER